MSEEKFPASFLIHNAAKIASVHWNMNFLNSWKFFGFLSLQLRLSPLSIRAMLTHNY